MAHAAHAVDLSDARERGAVRAVWSALFSDLLTAGLLAALCGAVVAGLAAQALPRIDVTAGRRWARGAATSPAPAVRLARAGGLIALGALLVLEPALAGRLVLIAAGLAVVALGISQLPSREAPEPAGERTATVGPRALAGALAVLLVTALVVALLVLPGPEPVTFAVVAPANSCNGSAAACGRRLDQVVFPATHNSFAAAEEPGWFFANQRYGIERQLRDGIRGFLIDVHYGAPDPRSGARADVHERARAHRATRSTRELSPEALRTADRLVGRSRVGRPEGERRAYLCHTLCELGAEPFDEQLELFARFLAANPSEVVILFVEPYVPVAEIERGLEATGLRGRRPGSRGWAAAHAAGADPRRHAPRGAGRAGRRRAAVVPARVRPGAGHAAGRHHAGRAALRALPRRARQPAVPRQPLDPALPALGVRQRAHRRRLPRAPARALRARARMLPNLVAVDFYEQSGVVDAAKGLNQ